MLYLQKCSPTYEGIGYRAIMSRVCGIDEVVPLQPDMAFWAPAKHVMSAM